VVIEHRDCGGRINDRRICERCGTELTIYDARVKKRRGVRDEPGRIVPAERV
jgi:hypothetical protein